jgi:hypothetical protein
MSIKTGDIVYVRMKVTGFNDGATLILDSLDVVGNDALYVPPGYIIPAERIERAEAERDFYKNKGLESDNEIARLLDRAERAEARIAELEAETLKWAMSSRLWAGDAERAEAKCKALREALETFANRSNWYTDYLEPVQWQGPDEPWKTARAALNPSPVGEKS